MSFTYTGNPSNSTVDAVRFLVGDTDSTEFFLHDAEILWLATQWQQKGSVYFTASMAAEAIAAKLTRETTTNSDGQSVSLSELQQKYLSLAETLRAQHKDLLAGGAVHAGGMTASEQYSSDTLPLSFGTQMHDNYEAGNQDYGDRSRLDFYQTGQWGEFSP